MSTVRPTLIVDSLLFFVVVNLYEKYSQITQ